MITDTSSDDEAYATNTSSSLDNLEAEQCDDKGKRRSRPQLQSESRRFPTPKRVRPNASDEANFVGKDDDNGQLAGLPVQNPAAPKSDDDEYDVDVSTREDEAEDGTFPSEEEDDDGRRSDGDSSDYKHYDKHGREYLEDSSDEHQPVSIQKRVRAVGTEEEESSSSSRPPAFTNDAYIPSSGEDEDGDEDKYFISESETPWNNSPEIGEDAMLANVLADEEERMLAASQWRPSSSSSSSSSSPLFQHNSDSDSEECPTIRTAPVEKRRTEFLQELAPQLLQEIEPNLLIQPGDIKLEYLLEQSENLQIMPDALRITLPASCTYCPVDKAEHVNAAMYVEIRQEGQVIVGCCSPGHKSLSYYHPCTKTVERLQYSLWSCKRWTRVYNKRLVQVGEGDKTITLEEYTSITEATDDADDTGLKKTLVIEKRAEFALKALHRGFTAYERDTRAQMKRKKNNAQEAEEAAEAEAEAEEEEEVAAAEASSSHLKKVDPIFKWFLHRHRRRCHTTCYAPGKPRIYKGNYNYWCNFGVKPAVDADYRDPVAILDHLRIVVADGNQGYYEYLLDWLAWLVQHPDIKSEVAVVLLGEKGAGKSSVGRILHALFGAHAFESSQKHHLFGKFNAHLRHKNILIVNEAVWGGDKRYESVLKAGITDPIGPSEGKGDNAFSSVNYWNFIVFSNDDWAVPATLDERRFFVLKVSSCRIGNKDYFDCLNADIDNPIAMGCFLRYLLERPLPSGWRPSSTLPRTPHLTEQAMQGNAMADLRWLTQHLKDAKNEGYWKFVWTRHSVEEDREIKTIEDIMLPNGASVVPKNVMLAAYNHDKKENDDLRRNGQLHSETDMTRFLEKHLGAAVFKANYRPRSSDRKVHYWFASAEEVCQDFADKNHISLE